VRTLGLACRNSTAKLKGALSMKARAKCEVSMKSKLPGAYKRSRKQKRKTHRVSKFSSEEIQSLSTPNRGSPPSLAIPSFLPFSQPTSSSIHISP